MVYSNSNYTAYITASYVWILHSIKYFCVYLESKLIHPIWKYTYKSTTALSVITYGSSIHPAYVMNNVKLTTT